jgi:hypothetical protein
MGEKCLNRVGKGCAKGVLVVIQHVASLKPTIDDQHMLLHQN